MSSSVWTPCLRRASGWPPVRQSKEERTLEQKEGSMSKSSSEIREGKGLGIFVCVHVCVERCVLVQICLSISSANQNFETYFAMLYSKLIIDIIVTKTRFP